MDQRPNQFLSQLANQLAAAHVRFISAGCVALFVAWATLFNVDDNRLVRRVMDFPASDKAGHLVLYAALTATVVWAAGDRRIARLGSVPIWPSLIFAIGIIEEVRQRGLDDRHFELADLAANTIGIWAGWVFAAWFLTRRSTPE